MLGFTCALEALSLANRHASGRKYYDWFLLGADGAPVRAWNGVTVEVDAGLVDIHRDDTLVVCAGVKAAEGSTPEIIKWLRRTARSGISIGAISSGTYTLALAGLVSGKRVTTHWEYTDALSETLYDATVQDTIYSVDGKLFTCAGGASSMDLMLHLIHEDYGAALADWVTEQMVYAAPREHSHAQRLALPSRFGHGNLKLSDALARMRDNLEDPVKLSELADEIGISGRQLERLFLTYLDTSPGKYYLGLRLEKARHLLRQTNMRITDVSVACGFSSPTHFARAYRRVYGVLPSKEASSDG